MPPSTGSADAATATPESLFWIDAVDQQKIDDFRLSVKAELDRLISRHALDYDILYLFDDVDEISQFHSNRLYQAAKKVCNGDKDLLLLVHSRGGHIEPAYIASKTLKRLGGRRFVVAVPRRAKSAATLLSLGADEIHMGLISELGPIDPQINGIPALALGNALEFVTELAGRVPNAASFLGEYVSKQAPLSVLGYFKRVSESASQYAERLLNGKPVGAGQTVPEVADKLVNHYKDHSFVIDVDEATTLLGPGIVKNSTAEYDLADELFEFLDLVRFVCERRGYDFWIVGSSAEANWRARK